MQCFCFCRHLYEEEANLVVTDINEDNVRRVVAEFGDRSVASDEIYGVDCDIFAPCALGAIINDATLPRLKCRVVAGAANNQLKETGLFCTYCNKPLTAQPTIS